VSGAAALVINACPSLKNYQVKQALIDGADNKGGNISTFISGGGRLDISGALAIAQQMCKEP
jgi:hypothetical protein